MSSCTNELDEVTPRVSAYKVIRTCVLRPHLGYDGHRTGVVHGLGRELVQLGRGAIGLFSDVMVQNKM